MGYYEESLAKKNVFAQKYDEIRRLDGMIIMLSGMIIMLGSSYQLFQLKKIVLYIR
jgi:hypothetical protein